MGIAKVHDHVNDKKYAATLGQYGLHCDGGMFT